MSYTNYNNTYNEGGEGYNPFEAEDARQAREKTLAERAARDAHIDANYEKYRTAWGAAVKQVSKGRKQITAADLAEIEKIAGITLAEVQAAKARNER